MKYHRRNLQLNVMALITVFSFGIGVVGLAMTVVWLIYRLIIIM